MKAKSLKKTSVSIENIYKGISESNANNRFKHFVPHDVYVSDEVRLKLIEDGYKVYKGNWDGIMTNVLIIEW